MRKSECPPSYKHTQTEFTPGLTIMQAQALMYKVFEQFCYAMLHYTKTTTRARVLFGCRSFNCKADIAFIYIAWPIKLKDQN